MDGPLSAREDVVDNKRHARGGTGAVRLDTEATTPHKVRYVVLLVPKERDAGWGRASKGFEN